jgi:hypothetical protein
LHLTDDLHFSKFEIIATLIGVTEETGNTIQVRKRERKQTTISYRNKL